MLHTTAPHKDVEDVDGNIEKDSAISAGIVRRLGPSKTTLKAKRTSAQQREQAGATTEGVTCSNISSTAQCCSPREVPTTPQQGALDPNIVHKINNQSSLVNAWPACAVRRRHLYTPDEKTGITSCRVVEINLFISAAKGGHDAREKIFSKTAPARTSRLPRGCRFLSWDMHLHHFSLFSARVFAMSPTTCPAFSLSAMGCLASRSPLGRRGYPNAGSPTDICCEYSSVSASTAASD